MRHQYLPKSQSSNITTPGYWKTTGASLYTYIYSIYIFRFSINKVKSHVFAQWWEHWVSEWYLLEKVDGNRNKSCNSPWDLKEQTTMSSLISSDVKTWRKNQYEEWSLIYTRHLIDCGLLCDVNKLLMFQEKMLFEAKWRIKRWKFYFYP